MPTLAELAGVNPPENIDGLSLVPTLLGEQHAGRKQAEHEYLYWEMHGQVAVRMGNFKAVKPKKNKPFELYDLGKDIEEKNNIAANHPEILEKLKNFAQQAHTPNVTGTYLPGGKEKRFKGHQAL